MYNQIPLWLESDVILSTRVFFMIQMYCSTLFFHNLWKIFNFLVIKNIETFCITDDSHFF